MTFSHRAAWNLDIFGRFIRPKTVALNIRGGDVWALGDGYAGMSRVMRGTPATALLRGGVVAIDPIGDVFAKLRSANLDVPLWRVTSRARLRDFGGWSLAILAAQDRPDWAAVRDIVQRMRLVIIAVNADFGDACNALALGAFGYVDASVSRDAFRRAIVCAMSDEPAYSRRVLAHALQRHGWFARSAKGALTPSQRQVVKLIARGAADKEIARTLGIATATAQKHVRNVLRKLGVPNRAAAAAIISGAPFLAQSHDSYSFESSSPTSDATSSDWEAHAAAASHEIA